LNALLLRLDDRTLRRTIAALAMVGAAIAAYLVYTRVSGATIACSTGGCEAVQSSRYAELLGLPISALGLGVYLALGACAISSGELARVTGATLALTGVGFGAYLLYVQVVVIGALCQWCIASDGVMSLLTVAAVLRLVPLRENRSSGAASTQRSCGEPRCKGAAGSGHSA
jgi:uncharacterized membrane protein